MIRALIKCLWLNLKLIDDEVPKILFGIVKVMEMSIFEIKHYPEKKTKTLMTSSIILNKIMKIIGGFLETGVGVLFAHTPTLPQTQPPTLSVSLSLSLTHTQERLAPQNRHR